ncbi:MAG: beta-lactamase family protein [Saprospirales bacterium]|nr:beta-lactamase family protein [Saprospirales bacterium]
MPSILQKVLLGTALLTALFQPLPAQQTAAPFQDSRGMPAGVAGHRTQALLAALNSNDPAFIAVFFDQHVSVRFRNMFPMAEHEQMFRNVFQMTGGLDFYSVRTYNPPRQQTVVIARDRLFDSWHGISFRLEGPDERITEINFTPARPPADAQTTAGPLSEAEVMAIVKQKAGELCQKDVFSGTILIAKGDQVLLEYACGEASKAWHVHNNINTRFNLGSMNKMFTATAVMQLVEKGQLRLDEPISRYVDESWLPRTITDRVTVQNLLTHTSGLGSYFNETYEKSSRDLFRQVSDYKPLVQGDTLSFAPGSRFQYSNTGMLLLGVVIEKASGENYFDYIRQHLYAPAAMATTDCYELDRPNENLADGYLRAPDGGWKNNLFMHVLKGGPAGGGYSTAPDLHRFARALQTGKLVAAASLEKMWQDHSGSGYGFGFGIDQTPAGPVVGHGGGFPGLNSNLDILTGSGYIAVVMSNYDMGAEPVKEYLRRMLGRIR